MGELTKMKVDYYYKKDHLNKRLNSLLFYPKTRNQLEIVLNKINSQKHKWAKDGISYIRGEIFEFSGR